ncbi:N(G),N(G)-dimethylarginine dimethylaminohydrolase [Pseudoclavibacter endophyticus]|uniref:N(G),N(G)-dimethylarginine dimethylaminohydrolase n=2 Tax=Pseudoclavibacter endophyticus TaxID=1778590 RepID=A0A6H9WVF2_9MICO|nr:N(G),N(G)-dimethylarginine dimethylaminohydrolase [Pseudoclavibacter endophyticus]
MVRAVERREAQDARLAQGGGLGDPRRFSEAAEKLAFVRVPAGNLDEAEVSGAERATVEADLAAEQWEAYVELLEEYGWETREVAAAETLPDSVFTEDPVVIIDDVAIIARPGAPSRRPELPGVRAAIEQAGFVLEELEKPATLDGGDVLVNGDTVYVGASRRTNAAGIRALRDIATGLGYRVVAVPIRDALHLRSVATALPDGTIVAWLDAFERPELLGRIVAAPERLGASVLPLDGDTVLVSKAAPKTARLIERLGYTVERLDISEFEKLEGGVTCLSARSFG